MSEKAFALGDVERLAAALDTKCADLDDRDQATLHAVFTLAGRAAAVGNEDEVSGFGSSPQAIIFVGGITQGGLFNSFQLGTSPPANPTPGARLSHRGDYQRRHKRLEPVPVT